METLFLYCAAVGGALLFLQLVLLLLAGDAGGGDFAADVDAELGADVGGDADVTLTDGAGPAADAAAHEAAHSTFLKLLSLQALTAFATFFGLGGLLFVALGWPAVTASTGAAAAGFCAMLAVARALSWMQTLHASGTLDLRNAVGKEARVYVPIPGGGQGYGRVTLAVQGRNVELKARSPGEPLTTGTIARVVGLSGGGAVVVTSVDAG